MGLCARSSEPRAWVVSSARARLRRPGQGGIDLATRDRLVAHRPPDWPLGLAVDASTMERCDAETGPERGFSLPLVAGWSHRWVTQLTWERSSWTAPPDARRPHPARSA
jgi:hypothetical protein